MREQLLDILAEPGTRAPLKLEVSYHRGALIDEGKLLAPSGRSYPIVRGIPRFVEGDTYAESFGMQWKHFRNVQLDSANAASYSQARFENETAWSADELKDKRVLDAGCGAGRFAEVAARRGANLVALDYSSAIDATAETLAPFANVDLVQGSILEPPFRPGVFDFAYCIGVVQHTPDPPAAIGEVVNLVRRNGKFCFTIYARRPWTKLNAKYLIRPLTRRMPQAVLLRCLEIAMPALFPLTDCLFRIPGIASLAHFAIPVANYVDRKDFSQEQRYHETILDTFDMLSPRYDAPLTWQETEASLKTAQAQSWEFHTRVPINVCGIR